MRTPIPIVVPCGFRCFVLSLQPAKALAHCSNVFCASLCLFAAIFNFSAAAQPLGNFGLVGVGRIPADSFDFLGIPTDTLGGLFSAMTVDQQSVSAAGSTYRATLYAQPDRGFGDGTN